MRFRRMELVLKVAELRSFTKAANALKIPQPSLSQSIAALEKELGIEIFNRKENPIALTQAGEIYLEKTRLIFGILDDLHTEISNFNSLRKGKISLGFSQNGYILLPNLLSNFVKKYKDIDAKITQYGSTLRIRQMILDGELDVGMLILPIDTQGLEYTEILTQNVYLALPSTHPLSLKFRDEKYPEISINLVKNEKFILPTQNLRSRKGYDEFFASFEIEPKILCEIETFEIANTIVANGVGACFTIPQMIKSDKANLIKLFKISEFNETKTLVLAYKKDKKLSKIEKEFIALAKELAGKI